MNSIIYNILVKIINGEDQQLNIFKSSVKVDSPELIAIIER
ncbi:hypothetical protein [Anabaena sp. PCC 7108]|nr:hypothetical protein [Anabaena sp. PCC 7108]